MVRGHVVTHKHYFTTESQSHREGTDRIIWAAVYTDLWSLLGWKTQANNESTKSLALNGSRSPAFSPTPT